MRQREGEITPERERESAFADALGALHRKERTTGELTEWLAGRGVREEVIEDVICELVEVGELDDERFARLYAEDKRELSGWGPERIEAALVQKGLDRGFVEAVAAEDGHEAQLDRAARLVVESGRDLGDERERARALAMLGRRGYGYDLAYEAIRRAGREG